MSSVVSEFWRVAASRSTCTGFRKNKQQMCLQACSGICDIPTGVAHEKMSLGHFSVSGCSRNLGRPRAVNPGNGNVPITPLWLPQPRCISAHLAPGHLQVSPSSCVGSKVHRETSFQYNSNFQLEFFLLFTWCWEVRFSRLQLEAKELENQTMRPIQE